MVGGHQTVLKICSIREVEDHLSQHFTYISCPVGKEDQVSSGGGCGKSTEGAFHRGTKAGSSAPFLVLMSPTAACPRTPPQGPLQRAPVEPRPIQLVLQDMFPPRSAGSALPGLPSTTGPGKTQLMAVLGCDCSALCHPLAIRALLPTAHAVFRCDFPHSSPRVMSAS